jgi:hypothetical protein
MPHGECSVCRVLAHIPSSSRVLSSTPEHLRVPLSAVRCIVFMMVAAHRWLNVSAPCRRSARRRHLPSSHAIHALAYCTGHARPLEPLPPRSRTHARTHMPALCNAPRGYRWVGYSGVVPPALNTCVGTRCQCIHCMSLCALACVSGSAFGPCHESCTGVAHVLVFVVRYAHAQ